MYLSSYDIDAYIDNLSPSETLQLAAYYGLIDRSINLADIGDLDGLFKKIKKALRRVVKKVGKVVKKIAPIAAVGAAVYFGGPAAASAIMNLANQKRAAKAAEQQVAAESLPLQPFITEAQTQQQIMPMPGPAPRPAVPVAPTPIYITAPGPAPMPQWVIPAAIGAVGLVLALTMVKR